MITKYANKLCIHSCASKGKQIREPCISSCRNGSIIYQGLVQIGLFTCNHLCRMAWLYILRIIDSMITNFQNSVKPNQFTQIIILCDTCMLTISEWGNTTIIHGMYVVTKVLHNIATKEVTGDYVVNAKVLLKLIFNSACKFWCINWGSPQSFEESVPRVRFGALVLPCVKHFDIAGSRLVSWDVSFNTLDVSSIQPQSNPHLPPFLRNLCSNKVHEVT